jgi:phosphate uptake regulator
MVVSKSLERIADHATVVYLCEAQDIRHTGMKSQGGTA